MKSIKMNKQKRIALVAHDNLKDDLVKWCKSHESVLKMHFLAGTGTTSRLIAEATGLPVKPYKSGPLGGDLQIGAKIADGELDMMIFFWDPLSAQPHDPDIKALLRIANVYDIPVATNRATADFMLTSSFMNDDYDHYVQDFHAQTMQRVEDMKK